MVSYKDASLSSAGPHRPLPAVLGHYRSLPDGFINNLPGCAQLESTMGSDSSYGFVIEPYDGEGQRYLKNASAGSEFPATVVSYGSDGKFLFYYGDVEDSIVEVVNFHGKKYVIVSQYLGVDDGGYGYGYHNDQVMSYLEEFNSINNLKPLPI